MLSVDAEGDTNDDNDETASSATKMELNLHMCAYLCSCCWPAGDCRPLTNNCCSCWSGHVGKESVTDLVCVVTDLPSGPSVVTALGSRGLGRPIAVISVGEGKRVATSTGRREDKRGARCTDTSDAEVGSGRPLRDDDDDDGDDSCCCCSVRRWSSERER